MRNLCLFAFVLCLAACATTPNATSPRNPASTVDMTGSYLGEGIFPERTEGVRRPAIRFYLDRSQDEYDTYYGVLVEYPNLVNLGRKFLTVDKAPKLGALTGYLNQISTRISAYKLVPGQRPGTYQMHNLEVRHGKIVPESYYTMVLHLNTTNASNPLFGASIRGHEDGNINFPTPREIRKRDVLSLTQYELATLAYKIGKLSSTWRGNWQDLEGSYLSEYGRVRDGVLELYSVNGQKKMKFIKPNTPAKDFTNPKSGTLEGDFIVSEPIPKMYILAPADNSDTASGRELTGRIGLFLDVFDASAPEAGSKLVTELVFTNSADDKDYLMYYQHPGHAKNVGVEPAKQSRQRSSKGK